MNPGPLRDLYVDQHATRDDLVAGIVDLADIIREQGGNTFTHLELARVFKAVADDDRSEYRIRRYNTKTGLLQSIDDAVDADLDVDETQDNFRKAQLVKVFLELYDATRQADTEADEAVVA